MALDEDFAELLLDFAELLDATLEEDLTELLEATLDDERTLLLDRSSTGAEDDERTLLLDFGVTLEEDFALLLDSLLLLDPFDSADAPLRVTLLDEEEDSSSILLDDSSSRGAKLLSSSPHAVKESPATARNIAKETRKERLIYPPNAVLSQNTNENIT